MDTNLLKSNLLREFFDDINVNFPTNPKIVKGISVYSMPDGLGIQFRGGSEKLILKGKNSFHIWTFLSEKLNGKHTLEIILKEANKNNINNVEVATFIKILHSNHLFESKNKDKDVSYDLDIFVEKQKEYYDRIIGLTGHNDDSYQVLEKIKNAKVLIVANTYLIPIICYNLYLAGFKDLGILYFENEEGSENEEFVKYTSNINIMTEVNISKMNNSEIRDLLNSKIDDYQFVLTVVNNPNFHFLHEISRFCNTRNKPVLNISFVENSYEVGPFFFPNTHTACSTCSTLRKQSYEANPIYDFLYQNNLNAKNTKYDSKIEGFDIQGFAGVLNFAVLDLKHVVANVSKSNFVNKILQMNALSLELKNTEIIPVLGCPTCSSNN
jgi:hypothetical protein